MVILWAVVFINRHSKIQESGLMTRQVNQEIDRSFFEGKTSGCMGLS